MGKCSLHVDETGKLPMDYLRREKFHYKDNARRETAPNARDVTAAGFQITSIWYHLCTYFA